MELRADLHIHPDWDEEVGIDHGDSPELIARGIVESKIDVYATTPHVKWFDAYHDRVRATVEELLDGTGREVLDVMGVELDVTFEGQRYHALYLFEERFRRENLPSLPDRWADFEEVETLQRDHPGIVIIPHPTLFDGAKGRKVEITQDLMAHPLVDGVELINGQGTVKGYHHYMRGRMSGRIRGRMSGRGGQKVRNEFDVIDSNWGAFKKVRESGIRVAPIGASDAHIGYREFPGISMVGTATTRIRTTTNDDVQAIFEQIRRGNTKAVARNPQVQAVVRKKMTKTPGMGRYIAPA